MSEESTRRRGEGADKLVQKIRIERKGKEIKGRGERVDTYL